MIRHTARCQRPISALSRWAPGGRFHSGSQLMLQLKQPIEVDGPPPRTLVKDLDFKLQAGERWAILGPNGSGKSTIARTLLERWEKAHGASTAYVSFDLQRHVLQDERRDFLESRYETRHLRATVSSFLFPELHPDDPDYDPATSGFRPPRTRVSPLPVPYDADASHPLLEKLETASSSGKAARLLHFFGLWQLRHRPLFALSTGEDGFVQDCGRGLDWASVAKKHWCYFAFLWLLVLLAFTIQQFLEEIAGNREGWYAPAPDGSRWLRIFQAFASCILFAISSAVVMNGAYIQFNLLLGLGKTLDCWCADITETQDFISGIQSWNSLQALLKCVGREITPCFTALFLLGYVGFFAALAGSFALLLDDGLDVWKTSIYEWSLLPLLYLFYLSTCLCAKGFIVNGVTLSQAAFLKQMHFLAAVFSGISGVLLRRYF